jgi:hypothetical protein
VKGRCGNASGAEVRSRSRKEKEKGRGRKEVKRSHAEQDVRSKVRMKIKMISRKLLKVRPAVRGGLYLEPNTGVRLSSPGKVEVRG